MKGKIVLEQGRHDTKRYTVKKLVNRCPRSWLSIEAGRGSEVATRAAGPYHRNHGSQAMIEVSLNACWTIVFLNKSHENPTPTVWVCENRRVYDRSLEKLGGLKHIEIIQHGASHVED